MLSRCENNRTKKRFTGLLSLVLCLAMLLSPAADAAGSRELTCDYDSDTDTWVQNGGYRPFTEWYNGSTAGIERTQIIYVYAKAGEKILCGSSVSSSTVNGGGSSAPEDILCTAPNGTVYELDVKTSGEGYINTRSAEIAGPYYTNAAGGTIGTSAGYTPLEITVGADEEGVWVFNFHSVSKSSTNPSSLRTNNTSTLFSSLNQTGTVAAWDVTVLKQPDTAAVSVATGRAYTYYLTLNSGANKSGQSVLNSVVYVLTNDGYIYRTDLNGIDPYGFVFFANNRGLINKDNDSSLYSSAVSSVTTDNNFSSFISSWDTKIQKAVDFHRPNVPDTELDQTFKIFFEIPADDLPETIKPLPYAPGQVSNFRFIGDTVGHGYVSSGGYFSFDVIRASSFQIKMDFSNYYNSTTGTWVNGGILYLANSCVDGENRIRWDGKDANGDVVPAGTYGSSSGSGIKVSIEIKAGEYDFPMVDVEYNLNGVRIKLMNDPVDASGNVIAVSDEKRCTVYFDNTPLFDETALPQYTDAELAGAYKYNALADGVNTDPDTAGTYGAAAYCKTRGHGSSNGTQTQGNNSITDIWTFYKGDTSTATAIIPEFELEDIPDVLTKGAISGMVYYNTSSSVWSFNLTDGDYELNGITVKLYDDTDTCIATAVTDSYGKYYFGGLDTGVTYTVRCVSPYPAGTYTCNPASLEISVPLTAVEDTDNDFAFNYSTLSLPIIVYKVWSVSKALDPEQPDSVIVRIDGKNQTTGTVEFTKDALVSLANGWKTTFSNLPSLDSDGNALVYTVTEATTDAFGNPITGYTSTAASYTLSSGTTEWIITNTANCSIVISKRDSALPTKPVAGCTFELYSAATDTLVETKTSGTNGKVIFNGLATGTYYYKEISAPSNYTFSALRSADITLTSAEFRKEFTVYNTPVTNSFTLTKRLSALSTADETFAFELNGPDGKFYATVTVPANSLSASVTFTGMLTGTYTAKELNTNWRYSVDTDAADTYAFDGVNTDDYADGILTLAVGSSGTYTFVFTNALSGDKWVDGSSSVVNVMQPLT